MNDYDYPDDYEMTPDEELAMEDAIQARMDERAIARSQHLIALVLGEKCDCDNCLASEATDTVSQKEAR